MITNRAIAAQKIVKSKSEKQKGAIIVAIQPYAGKYVLSEPIFDILPRKRMNERIVDYPVGIVPKKLVAQIKSVNRKADNNKNYDQYKIFFCFV